MGAGGGGEGEFDGAGKAVGGEGDCVGGVPVARINLKRSCYWALPN